MTQSRLPTHDRIAIPAVPAMFSDKLLENFSSRINNFALRYLRSNPWADEADLKQAGRIALWNALKAFDEQQGKPFEHFATVVIRNAIADEARRSIPADVRLRKMAGLEPIQMAIGDDDQVAVNGRLDSEFKSVNNDDVNPIRVDSFAEADADGGIGVIAERSEPDFPLGGAALRAYTELTCDPRADDHPQRALEDPTFDSCLCAEFEEWIAALSGQYQRVIHLHFCAGFTHREVADEIGVRRQRVSAIAAQLTKAWRARNGFQVH